MSLNNGVSKPATININPLAVLAAVVFNIGKTDEIEIKCDDSERPKKMLVKPLATATEEEAAVCILPMEKIIKYAATPYTFKFRVEGDTAIVSFEKASITTQILAPNGKQISTESEVISKLLQQLQ